MPAFSPGDKVSFIRDKLSGTVKQVSGRGEVLVRLDDGFEIPVDVRELILVEKASASTQEKGSVEEKFISPRAELQEKIAAGFITEGNSVKAYLLNNSPHHLLYVVFNISTPTQPGLIAQGSLEKATSVFLASFPLSESEKWRQWRVQLLRYGGEKSRVMPVIDYSFKVRDTALVKEKDEIPFLGKKGFVMDIPLHHDDDRPAERNKEEPARQDHQFEPVEKIIDLHADDMPGNIDSIKAESILQSQLNIVRNSLEKAAAQGLEQIIFIHGVGSGILKREIQKILMRHKDVKRWEEADTKKFGYGATAVYLKTR